MMAAELSFYKSRSPKVLTREEQDLYLNSPKKKITIDIAEEDHQFIQDHGWNMARILFFVVHEWLAKKQGELAAPPKTVLDSGL